MYLNKTSGNLNPRGEQPQSVLQISTVRSFEGGLNVTDTDLNMSPKYAKVLDNIERNIDGSLAIRPGTKLVSNTITSIGDIVNIFYFNGYVISVQTGGAIWRTASDGTSVHMLIGAGDPWGAGITEANFAIYNSDLIIVNGKDKPLIIAGKPLNPDGSTNLNYMALQFLIDPATGTNVNTPICKYVATHDKYLCMAGTDAEPSTVFISSTGTSGTWPSDPDPNDAIALDVGPRVSMGSSTITGLCPYRDKLLVSFERGILPLTLGVFTGDPAIHTPTDDGFIEEFGSRSHRGMLSVGDDAFFADKVGVNSINRVNVFNTLRPVRISHLVDPLITEALGALTQEEIQTEVFAVYDLQHFRYMLFIPVYTDSVRETVCFSYMNIPALKITAWSRLRGWNWQAACRTANQTIVFAQGKKLYVYDFVSQTDNADFLDDPDIESGAGVEIAFDWEMPWTDFKHRMDIKMSRYIGLDTQGNAQFTTETYIDNVERYHGERVPLLSATFVGGDSAGYGAGPYGDDPYGGGRHSNDERLYAWPAKFKLMKLRFFGSSKRKLKFISISIAFIHGSIRR